MTPSGQIDDRLRPADAAKRLGLAQNTLRVYAARFTTLLGDSAARPPLGPNGQPGHRQYTERDLSVLRRAKQLVDRGLSYEQALTELERDSPRPIGLQSTGILPARPMSTVDGTAAGTLTEPRTTGQWFDASGDALTPLRQAVDAWRALAEEHAREIAQLHARLDSLASALSEERLRRIAAEELIRLVGDPSQASGARKGAGGQLGDESDPEGSPWWSRLLGEAPAKDRRR